MRLNLPKYNCVLFEISSEFTVSLDKDAEVRALISQTHTHDPDGESSEGPRVALFGSRTKARGVTHRVRGRLIRTPKPNELNLALLLSSNKASVSLRPPPRSFKPASYLVELASRLFGPIPLTCQAIFKQHERDWKRCP